MKAFKIGILFISLLITHIIFLKVLGLIGFKIVMAVKSLLLPPLLATLVLLILKKEISHECK